MLAFLELRIFMSEGKNPSQREGCLVVFDNCYMTVPPPPLHPNQTKLMELLFPITFPFLQKLYSLDKANLLQSTDEVWTAHQPPESAD